MIISPRQPRLRTVLVAVAMSAGLACGGTAHEASPATPSAVSGAASSAAEPGAAADLEARRQALTALLDEHWEYTLRQSPEFASILGDKRYNDQLSDNSLAAIEASLADTRVFLAKFSAIDTTGFPEQEALNQQLMVRNLEDNLAAAKFEGWLMPVSQQSGIHIGAPQFAAFLSFTNVKDYNDYITRLRKLPKLFANSIELMQLGKAKGLMPPKHILEQAAEQTRNLSKIPAEQSPFAKPLANMPDTIPAAEPARIRDEILAAIRDVITPTYVSFADFLANEYAPHGRTEPGYWALPQGKARYELRIKQMTTTDMGADEIHELGLSEVARIEAEQTAIGRSLGYQTLDEFRAHIRQNKDLYAKSREDIIERYKKHTAAMYKRLPELFGRLPKAEMEIRKVEEFREKEASGAQYMPPAKDGSRPGIVRVNTYKPTERMIPGIESTAYHEGVPGHHLQLAIQQELPVLPPFRQQGGYTAFSEGWALYSEALGKEIGFFQDPYSDYGRLEDEMLRAIRLVVDTGFHAKKWSRQQVVDFFHAHSTIDEPSVQSETDRYIAWPAQALAYKVGQLHILKLRRRAEDRLGDRFDIRDFHDLVLGAGALPLDILELRVDAWLDEVAPRSSS